jgi:phosphoserine phosphatase
MARFDVVAFDLDGTLLRGTTVSRLTAERAGRGHEAAVLEERYAAGEIGNDVVASASLAWLDESAWAALDDAPWIAGIDETIAALRAAGVATLVATLTWRRAAEHLAARHGFDGACGTEVLEDGTLRLCDEQAKAAFVVDWCTRRGIAPARLAAVGDARSDLPLFAQSGLAIALNATPAARAAAQVAIETDDLRDVLPLLGVA